MTGTERILDRLAVGPATAQELADAAELNVGHARRLLGQLARGGHVTQDRIGGPWRLLRR